MEDEVESQFSTLADAEMKAKSITSIKKDDPKAVRDVAECVNSCGNGLIELKEKVKDRRQNLMRAEEQLNLYRSQLEPVEKVFSQVEDVVMDVPVSEDELGKVEVRMKLLCCPLFRSTFNSFPWGGEGRGEIREDDVLDRTPFAAFSRPAEDVNQVEEGEMRWRRRL